MGKNSFLSKNDLLTLGLKKIGENVKISNNANFYNAHLIEIGSNVRIDDFCILSGNIQIGSNIHISAYCLLFAGDSKITLKDFSGLSSRVAVYALTDDYSGDYLTNPTIAIEYRNVIKSPVCIEKHVIVGTGSTILPGVTIHEGSAIGAMSLVTRDTQPFSVNTGIPARFLKERRKNVLELEKEYISKISKCELLDE